MRRPELYPGAPGMPDVAEVEVLALERGTTADGCEARLLILQSSDGARVAYTFTEQERTRGAETWATVGLAVVTSNELGAMLSALGLVLSKTTTAIAAEATLRGGPRA